MNNKALDLNLNSTHFVTPHGLDDDNHYTTAYELALLSNIALQNDIFRKIVGTKYYTVYINGNPKNIKNTNELLGVLSGVYGIKTGFTNGANRCLVSAFKHDNLDIICVVLGCDTKNNRTKDSINLINYIINNFTVINVEEILNKDFYNWYQLHLNSFKINKGTSQIIDLIIDKTTLPYSSMAIKKSDFKKVKTKITFSSYHEAPIISNTILGNMYFLIDDKELFKVDVINTNEITKKDILFYFTYILSNYRNFFKGWS